MWLQVRMYLLIAVLFGILYGALVLIGSAMGWGGALTYIIMALAIIGLQYLVSPVLVSWTMRIKWVTDVEEPQFISHGFPSFPKKAGLPMPRVGIAEISLPNAFAFGRSQKDGRICVTRGILSILNQDELRAVVGHEMSHIKPPRHGNYNITFCHSHDFILGCLVVYVGWILRREPG